MKCERKIALRELPSFEMAAERWICLMVSLLMLFGYGKAMVGECSKATYLAAGHETYDGMDVNLMVQSNEPNDAEKKEHEQKTWCNQCMRKENGMPMVESKESSYKENEEEVTRRKRERELVLRGEGCEEWYLHER